MKAYSVFSDSTLIIYSHM